MHRCQCAQAVKIGIHPNDSTHILQVASHHGYCTWYSVNHPDSFRDDVRNKEEDCVISIIIDYQIIAAFFDELHVVGRLVSESQAQERVDGKGRVAYPDESVVPVSRTTDRWEIRAFSQTFAIDIRVDELTFRDSKCRSGNYGASLNIPHWDVFHSMT